jgi:hypothetical protein
MEKVREERKFNNTKVYLPNKRLEQDKGMFELSHRATHKEALSSAHFPLRRTETASQRAVMCVIATLKGTVVPQGVWCGRISAVLWPVESSSPLSTKCCVVSDHILQ